MQKAHTGDKKGGEKNSVYGNLTTFLSYCPSNEEQI